MTPLRALLVALIAARAVAAATASGGSAAAANPPVRVIELDGAIDPVSAIFVERQLRAADREDAAVVVIRMDTPGGLLSAMRDIVGAIGASSRTVVVWVAPSGAHAGSAGAFIAASSDYISMAPGTNIGSATPISSGGQDLSRKVINDAAALIASLAEEHGRPPAPFRRMVTEGLNLTASQALAQGVIETVQPSLPALLKWLDGRPGRDGRPLAVSGAPIATSTMPWYLRLLEILTDPNLVFFLLLLGLAGIGFEIFNPGAILPGVVGGISLLLALAGLTVLPFTWTGVALILLAVILFIAETQVGGFGALALGGVISLALGGAFLFDSSDPALRPSLWAVVAIAVVIGGAFALAARAVLRARARPSVNAGEELVGTFGTVRSAIDGEGGRVLVAGELWSAHSADGAPLAEGQRVRVVRVHPDDLTLTVEPGEG